MSRLGTGSDLRFDLPQLPSRFELIEPLGSGGMGVVYKALARDAGAPVAVKVMKRISADALLRLKDEFRVLQDLHHPNLVRYGELIEHRGHWFFTMELVDGQNFLTWVRPGPAAGDGELEHARPTSMASPSLDQATGLTQETAASPVRVANRRRRKLGGTLDVARLRAALPQIVSGLSYLHAAGKIHRDIKPSNILVTPQGRVVLLDFGVAADVHAVQPGDPDREVVGTPAYMAPEQARGEGLHPAADWYSLGVVLFLALTGEHPPDPHTAAAVEPLAALRVGSADLPADLARVFRHA